MQNLSPKSAIIWKKGQEKLSRSYVVVIGCGALGSIISTSLVRAGVGKVSRSEFIRKLHKESALRIGMKDQSIKP